MGTPGERISVVVPIFNERQNLPTLAAALRELFDAQRWAGEVILVSDGSTDGSNGLIEQLARHDALFQGVILSRNFGHQAAVSTGLELAEGEVVVVMDGDLQDPPAFVAQLVETLHHGADVAYAVRKNRKESLPKRLAYAGFYRLQRAVASIDIPIDAGDFCAMRRAVVDAMLTCPERRRFVRGLRAWAGFTQVGVPYDRAARAAGETKYSWKRLITLAYDGLFGFSSLPVKLMQGLGFCVSLAAMATAMAYLTWRLISPAAFPVGWATLVISIWFLGGLHLLFLGLLGEYVFRTFEETRARPTAVVSRVIGQTLEPRCKATTHRLMRTSTSDTGGGAAASNWSSARSAA